MVDVGWVDEISEVEGSQDASTTRTPIWGFNCQISTGCLQPSQQHSSLFDRHVWLSDIDRTAS